MLRMVFCDVDGTLLPKSADTLTDGAIEMLRRLTDRGILVVIASGRPYAQLKPLFHSLKHRLIFLCLDGAVVMHRDCVLYKQPLSKTTVKALAARYGSVAVHGREKVYAFGNPYTKGQSVFTLDEIPEDFLKAEFPAGIDEVDGTRAAYRNSEVTELVSSDADKGAAARVVMQKFGVSRDQAVAFGDGENDVPLLHTVGHPYRMVGTLCAACPEAAVAYTVEGTLNQLFNIHIKEPKTMLNEKIKQAEELHALGHNCAQSVFIPFAEQFGMDKKTAMRVAEGFGAGMGNRTQTCGALSGAVAVIGLCYSDGDLKSPASKAKTYAVVGDAVEQFRTTCGSTICKEIKDKQTGLGCVSCADCIAAGVRIAAEAIE